MTTRTHPACVYCGTTRPAAAESCPECGRGWIDSRIAPDTATETPDSGETLAGPATGQPFPTIDHEPPPLPILPEPRSRRGPVLAAIVVAVILAAAAVFAATRGGDDGTAVAGPEASSTTSSAAPSTTASTTTTSAGPSTTQTPTTSTTTTSTTTTSTTTPVPAIEAVGDPIPPGDLPLGAFAIGPFDFGVPAAEPIARLVATFGQPDDVTEAGEQWGICAGETGRVFRWDSLRLITRLEGDTEVLVAYRVDASADPEAEPAPDLLATLSGLRVGNTTDQLEAIYANSSVDYLDVDGVPSFRLLRSSDARLLLWGPVTDGAVAGIYSPRPCDQGP